MKRTVNEFVRVHVMVAALFTSMQSTGLTDETNEHVRSPVMIYEVCLKPDQVLGPRWVKLRSFSGTNVNLKGYSLHDRTSCFYRFDQDSLLMVGRTFILFFYPQRCLGEQSGLYSDRVLITNSRPFSATVEMNKTSWSTLPSFDHEELAADLLGRFTIEQYDYLKRVVDDYRNRTGVVRPSRPVMMEYFALYGYHEYDEVALVDMNGKLVSFVGWGSGSNLDRPITSKWEKVAIDNDLMPWRTSIGSVQCSDSIFDFPAIILERNGPDKKTFRRMPFGTPRDTQCKDPIRTLTLNLDEETGRIKAGIGVKSSCDPWKCLLEISGTVDFKEIVCRKRGSRPGGFWSLDSYSLKMDVNLSDEEIRVLCKYDAWYYRARREFNDGCNEPWSEDVKVISRDKWLSKFGDTPRTMAENLIETRQKSGASVRNTAAESAIESF